MMDHDTPSQAGRGSEADHRRASAALPWLLNGTAPEAERRFVEAHLQGCESCRAEWQQQQRWHAAMTEPTAPRPGATRAPDAQAGLQRLWARIDTADSVVSAAVAGRHRTPPPGRSRRSAALVYGLMATVMVEALALSVLGVAVYLPAEPPAAYETLSAAPSAASPQGSHRVVFDSSLTLAAMQQLLQQTGLQVVSGPNLAGAFVLAPVQAGEDSAALLARLRAAPGVRLAEPVAGAGAGAGP